MSANLLSLPQLDVSFGMPLPPRRHLLVAGGRAPADGWLRAVSAGCAVWCIDRGLDACFRLGIVPGHVFGDGDSASPEAWGWARRQSIPMERYPVDKDATDTQLALAYAAAVPGAFFLVTGCFGGRLDHLYSIVFSCAHAGIPCALSDDRETLLLLEGGQSASISCRAEPKALSLLPLTASCRGVTLQGVRWPLLGASLLQSFPYAVSNRPASGGPIPVSLTDGILGIYFRWEEQKPTPSGAPNS